MNAPIKPPRHGIAGYYALADLPQRQPLSQSVLGTGWEELDKIFKIYPGQLVIVTGNAGSGKSTFVFNLLINLSWHHKFRHWIYAPENELNLFEKMQNVFGDAKDGSLFGRFAHTQCFVQSSNYEHYNDAPRDIEFILGHAYEAWMRDKINLATIDPWNELERAKLKDELLTDYIARCLMRVKMFARETGCAVLMIAHPTKAANGRDVTLGDIEGSLAWFNKCDNGLIVKREAGSTTVISAKVREQPYAGRIGHCVFLVDENTGLFTQQVNGGQAL
jgi:twinkle protein